MRHERSETARIEPRGQSFTRSVIAQALAGTERFDAADYAGGRWHFGSRAHRVTKAAVTAGTTSPSSWTSPMVGDEGASAEFLATIAEGSILGRLTGARRIGFRVPVLVTTTAPQAAWVGEGHMAPVVSAALARASFPPLKIAGIAALTKELLETDSAQAEAMVQAELTTAAVTALDRSFSDPSNSGTPGEEPASILNGVTPTTGTGDPAGDLAALIGNFGGDLGTAFLVTTPLVTAGAAGADRPGLTTRGGFWGGLPVVISRYAPNGLLALVDASQVVYALDMGAVRQADQATLVIADAGTMASASGSALAPTESQQVSLFQVNCSAFSVMVWANWTLARADGAAFISGVSYGGPP